MRIKLLYILLLISLSSCLQFNASMQLKSGELVNDKVRPIHKYLVSTITKKKYHFDNVLEFSVYKKDSIIEHYYPLHIKNYKNDDKVFYGLGMKVYDSDKLELFHARFPYFRLDYTHTYIDEYLSPRVDTFIRKKGEPIAYSIACIDAMGCDTVLQRVLQFFDDCPEVNEQIVSGNIEYTDIITIADYYNMYCGKD